MGFSITAVSVTVILYNDTFGRLNKKYWKFVHRNRQYVISILADIQDFSYDFMLCIGTENIL